ncbi:MAG: DoxX family protein [Chitinophagaceae bacterium]|nr:MAG: DoxX family protein [Chitinophagaceae bacterium]
MTNKQKAAGLWILRILPAVILLQTLFFKFSASPESVYIFSKTGMEPWGRIGSGIMELIAAVLILIPATTGIGALIAVGLMAGALFFHLTSLGIVVMDDGGQLFVYALLVFATCVALLFIHRKKLLAPFRKRRQLIETTYN